MAEYNYNRELMCKDCVHAKGSFMAKLTRSKYAMECTIPEAWNEEKYDPVFGKITPGYFSGCSSMRLPSSECGPEGKYWTPKNTKLIFLKLKHG